MSDIVEEGENLLTDSIKIGNRYVNFLLNVEVVLYRNIDIRNKTHKTVFIMENLTQKLE